MGKVKIFFPNRECRKEKGVRFLLLPTYGMGSLMPYRDELSARVDCG